MLPFNEGCFSPPCRPARVFQQHISVATIRFSKNLLSIEDVGNEHPEGSGNEVLSQVLLVGLVVLQLPLKGK